MSDLNEAIRQVREELDRVRKVKKCASCECLLDVLEAVRGDLGEVGTPEAEAARVDMQRWFEAGNPKRHRCLGCEVCLPIEPYNRFSALLRDRESVSTGSVEAAPTACGCGDT